MIERLHNIAKVLYKLRYLSAVLGIAALIYGAYSLFLAKASDDSQLLVAMTVFIWCGLAYCIGTLLNAPPPELLPSDSFIKRFKTRLHLGLYWVVGFMLIVLITLVLLASYQFIRAALTLV